MFSKGSLSSISLAMLTPSSTMEGEPYPLSNTTLRPLGPKDTLTTSAKVSTPLRIFALKSRPNKICFAINIPFYFSTFAKMFSALITK